MDVLEVTPSTVVRDLHPDYLTTGIAERDEDVPWPPDAPVFAVQHHHAHILSTQAEAGMTGPCLGMALDGTGYGTDGTIWGGEILFVDGTRMERVGHLRPVWMPGGEKAIEEPWRMAVSCLVETSGDQSRAEGFFPGLPEENVRIVSDLCRKKIHGVMTSSAGRLFDAVSALLGICTRTRYEGQPAIELEAAADKDVPPDLPYLLTEGEEGTILIDMMPAFARIVELAGTQAPGRIAGMFHRTMARAFTDAACRAVEGRTGLSPVIFLSGGVFQNELFCGMIAGDLRDRGLRPVFHRCVPTNDGGISLGQAVWGLCKQREDR